MKYIPLFFAVVLMVFGCSSTVHTKTTNLVITQKVVCDTFYYRAQDEEVGDYYLIVEVVCDTIPVFQEATN